MALYPCEEVPEPAFRFVTTVIVCSAIAVCALVLGNPLGPETTYSIITTAGLAFDVAGVTLLFIYGMPPRVKVHGLVEPFSLFATAVSEEPGPPSDENISKASDIIDRNRRHSLLGFIFVIEGFVLQAVASWLI